MKHFKTVMLLFFLLLASCSGNLDFNQAEDFKHQPVVKTSLIYFTLFSNNFMDPVTSAEITNGLANEDISIEKDDDMGGSINF